MSLATETTYVTNIFQNVLFHTAADIATAGTTAQINSWANLIVSGTLTEAQVLSNLSSSNEVVNYVLPIVQLYEGFYHATPDIAGLTNWVNYFRSVAPISASGTPSSSTAYQNALSSIAQVFAQGTQFTNTYGSAPTAAAFVTALYQNILGRAPDAAGLAGYVAYLTSTAGASPSVSAMASLALSFINSTEAKADATPAVESWLAGGINGTYATTIPGISSPAATTQALTTGIDNLVGTTANNVFTGVVGGSAPTLNVGDVITGSSSGTNTLKLIDVSTAAVSTNELAGVTLSNVQNVIVTNVNTVGGAGTVDGLYDFTTVSGVTTVESLNSTGAGIVKFTNLAAGTNVEASGAATTASVNFTYLSASSAPTVTVDGGISGITLANVGTSAAPTAATINSTGAANSATFVLTNAGASLTSLTVNASTNLAATLTNGDFATNGAALVVKGAASSVNLGTAGIWKTIDASGLTGGLTVNSDNKLTSFIGGSGNDSLLGTALSSSATSIDGGAGVNTVSAALITAGTASIFKNFQVLDISNFASSIDASLLTNSTVSGVAFNLAETGSHSATVNSLAAAATLTVASGGVTATAVTLTHAAGAATNSLAVNFADPHTTADNGASSNTISTLTSTGDATVSISSGGTAAATANVITSLVETNNLLTTVTITGANAFTLGAVHTDSAASISATTASSLTLIDASASTGGVTITAGGTDTVNSQSLTYTGLTIKGGSGLDNITNNATNGIVIDGNHNGDTITLGGAGGSATFGTGASDIGNANNINQTFSFGTGATGKVVLGVGAEAGTALTATTTISGTAAGFLVDIGHQGAAANTGYTTYAGAIVNETTAASSAGSLAAALNAVVTALTTGGTGSATTQFLGYFQWGHDQYIVSAHGGDAALTQYDSVVHLTGVSYTGLTASAGVITLG